MLSRLSEHFVSSPSSGSIPIIIIPRPSCLTTVDSAIKPPPADADEQGVEPADSPEEPEGDGPRPAITTRPSTDAPVSSHVIGSAGRGAAVV